MIYVWNNGLGHEENETFILESDMAPEHVEAVLRAVGRDGEIIARAARLDWRRDDPRRVEALAWDGDHYGGLAECAFTADDAVLAAWAAVPSVALEAVLVWVASNGDTKGVHLDIEKVREALRRFRAELSTVPLPRTEVVYGDDNENQGDEP